MKKFLICWLIFIVTGIGSAFLGVPGEATFVVGGVCVVLYLIFSRKKDKSTSTSSSSQGTIVSPERSSPPSYQTSQYTDYFDERNIPSHWAKARACDRGDHNGATVSRGDATHCHVCGQPFEGEWGDRGVFDGYVCKIHGQWIPGGSYCMKCKNEGLIN